MYMHEWNSDQPDAILLIHPMLSSANGMKSFIIDHLDNSHRYVVPDLSAHGDAIKETYISAENEAEEIHNYLIKHHITRLKLGYGASLGGVVLLQLLQYHDISFDHLFFEGTSFYTHAPFMEKVLRSVFLSKHKKAVNDPDLCREKMTSMFGKEGAPLLAKHFIAMNEESIIHIVHDCLYVNLPDLSEDIQKKCTFAYGDSDFDYKKAKKSIPKIYPHAEMIVWEGYGHCAKLSEDPVNYASELRKYL